MAADLLQLKQIDKDELLYHYTKSAGVQGILENNSFWATKSNFLNDPKECSYFMTKIKTICRELFSEFEQQDFLLERFFGDEEKKPKEKEYFVLSFSSCPDSITLWSEFGSKTGYNMAFEGDKIIQKIAKANDISYHGYVIYEEEEKRKYIKDLLWNKIPARLNTSFPQLVKNATRNPKDELFEKACHYFKKYANIYAMFFKNDGFKEEREYRFLFKKHQNTEVHFREKDGFFIPYIVINAAGEGGLLPIRSITVAPQNHIDLAKKGIEYYLKYYGYDVEVSLSNIKLRY